MREPEVNTNVVPYAIETMPDIRLVVLIERAHREAMSAQLAYAAEGYSWDDARRAAWWDNVLYNGTAEVRERLTRRLAELPTSTGIHG